MGSQEPAGTKGRNRLGGGDAKLDNDRDRTPTGDPSASRNRDMSRGLALRKRCTQNIMTERQVQ